MKQKIQEYLNKQLLEAFKNAKSEDVKILIELGADIKTIDVNKAFDVPFSKRNLPLLSVACGCGKLDLVKLLHENGADLNKYDAKSFCPIHYATMGFEGNCYQDIVEYLVENGANVNAICHDPRDLDTSEWDTPLTRAIYFGNSQTVKYLLNHGAKIKYGSPLKLCEERLKKYQNGSDLFNKLPDFEKTLDVLKKYNENSSNKD